MIIYFRGDHFSAKYVLEAKYHEKGEVKARWILNWKSHRIGFRLIRRIT